MDHTGRGRAKSTGIAKKCQVKGMWPRRKARRKRGGGASAPRVSEAQFGEWRISILGNGKLSSLTKHNIAH
jgi:hypothetical protein